MVSTPASSRTAPRPFRLLFWLILGGLSTALAEVPTGSDLFPFFHPQGLLLTAPLYALHILVLGTLVLRWGQPRPAPLYLAGVLFGLHEAYLTKVLWQPPWGEPLLTAGGMGVAEFLVITACVHPLLAFILPLSLAEIGLTRSREIVGLLPSWLTRQVSQPRRAQALLALGAVTLGAAQSGNSPGALSSLASGLLTGGLLLALILLWRGLLGGQQYSLRQLLPTAGEWWILVMLLAALYLALGLWLRPEALPGLGAQATLWAVYAVVGGLLWLALRQSRRAPPAVTPSPGLRFSPALAGILLGLFSLAAAGFKLALGPAAPVLLSLVWAAGATLAVVFIIRAACYALQGEPPVTPNPPASPV